RRHRREVLDRIVRQLLEQVLVGCVRRVGRDEYHVAIGRRLGDQLRGNETGGARTVVDDDRLLGQRAELLTQRARQLVGGAAGREGHDQRDLLVRVLGLYVGRERDERQHDAPKAADAFHVSYLRRRASTLADPAAADPRSVGERLPRPRCDLSRAGLREITHAARECRLQPRQLPVRECYALIRAVKRLELA